MTELLRGLCNTLCRAPGWSVEGYNMQRPWRFLAVLVHESACCVCLGYGQPTTTGWSFEMTSHLEHAHARNAASERGEARSIDQVTFDAQVLTG
jgi:hypothetical protein